MRVSSYVHNSLWNMRSSNHFQENVAFWASTFKTFAFALCCTHFFRIYVQNLPPLKVQPGCCPIQFKDVKTNWKMIMKKKLIVAVCRNRAVKDLHDLHRFDISHHASSNCRWRTCATVCLVSSNTQCERSIMIGTVGWIFVCMRLIQMKRRLYISIYIQNTSFEVSFASFVLPFHQLFALQLHLSGSTALII